MYAVIKSGGKQYKVEEGQQLDVERLGLDQGHELELTPVLVVDGGDVLATPAQLGTVKVSARVVGEAKGDKIRGFTYKNKSNQRRHWGHRQRYSTIEIVAISKGAAKKARAAKTAAPAETDTAEPGPAESEGAGTEGEG
jgi:large subunit ribosomal protein L21